MNTTKRTKTKPGRNEAQGKAARERRLSNAATRHDARPNRQRTRATQKRFAMEGA